MNLLERIEQSESLNPGRPALLFEGETTSYNELLRQAARAAGVLSALGVGRGDRVALFLPNHPSFVIAFLAAMRIGAIAVPIHARSTGEELCAVLEDSGAEILVTTAALRAHSAGTARPQSLRHVLIAEGDAGSDLSLTAAMEGATPCTATIAVSEETPAAILYTSGTTEQPKGVSLSHGNIDFVMRSKVACMGISPEDRLLLFLPMSHCFGLNAVLLSALAGGACVVLLRKFALDEVLLSIEREQATMFFGVPTTFLLLEKASREQLRPVRYFFSAAAPLPQETEDRWTERFGSIIHQGYGQTECSPFATYNHLHHHRPGSVGTAVPGVELAIGDLLTGKLLPPGERGEVLVRGPNVMLGYWQRPLETAECIRDGWLHTGDVGRLDEEGYLRLEDRIRDIAIVGGVNVYPAEVERTLLLHPAVREAAVFGRPDPVLGERVFAAVVLEAEANVSAAELTGLCSERLAEYKIPAAIEFVAGLPKGPTGKVLKRVLRERDAAMNSPERNHPRFAEPVKIAANRAELEERIAGWLARILDVKPSLVLHSKPFAEYGVTSLMAVELAGKLCGWLGRPVSPTIAWQFSSVADLAGHCFPESARPQPHKLSPAVAEHLESLAHVPDAEAVDLLREELLRINSGGEREVV